MSAAEPIITTPEQGQPAPITPTTPAPEAVKPAPTSPERPFFKAPGEVANPPAPAAPAKPAAGSWLEGLSDDDLSFISAKGWDKEGKSAADVVKSYRNLERLRGVDADKLMKRPDWSKEESVAEYRKSLGVPDSPEGYQPVEVQIPTGVIDPAPLAKLANRIHLDQNQFTGLMQGTGELLTEIFQAENERIATEQAAGLVALHKEWGTQTEANEQHVNRAIQAFKISEDAYEALKMSPLGEAGLKRMLANAGAMLGEHQQPRSGVDAPSVRSSEWAQGEIQRLQNDQGFLSKMGSGDTEARRTWDNLLKIAYGD